MMVVWELSELAECRFVGCFGVWDMGDFTIDRDVLGRSSN
jgi:hypothetical protein